MPKTKPWRRVADATAMLVILAVGGGCADEGTPLGNLPPETGISYERDIQTIWNLRCDIACHGASGQGGLDLRPGQSYDLLVGAISPTYQQPRVDPGFPLRSVLYHKLNDTMVYGGRMPDRRPPLPSNEILTIFNWIEAGAPRN